MTITESGIDFYGKLVEVHETSTLFMAIWESILFNTQLCGSQIMPRAITMHKNDYNRGGTLEYANQKRAPAFGP